MILRNGGDDETYSPKVQAIENLPTAGWDEWYSFPSQLTWVLAT